MRPPKRLALVLSLLSLAAAAPAVRADTPAKKPAAKAAPGKPAPAGFAAHEVSTAHQELNAHHTTVVVHSKHGKMNIKKAIPHVAIHPDLFKKHADKSGNVKLPNGKVVKVGDWHAAVNHMEKALNGIGHSIHHEGKTRLGDHAAGHAELDKHAKAAAASHKPNPKRVKSTLAHASAHHDAIVALRASNGSATTTAANRAGGTTTVKTASVRTGGNDTATELDKAASMAEGVAVRAETAKTFNISAGDPAHFSAYLKGKAALQGDATFTGLHADIAAGGSLMGHSQDILNVNADFTAKKNGELEARVDASIAKKSIYSLSKRATKSWSKTERIQKSVDVSATVPIFSLGAVSVVAKIGVSGSAGIDYGMALGPGIVGGHVTPFVHTEVYVQASLKLAVPVAEAGAQGKLTLLNDELELTASASLVPANVKGKGVQWGVYSKMELHNSMEMLKGDVSVFLKLHYPCMKGFIPHICSKEFDHHLFGWNGMKTEGDLFHADKFVSLGIPATKMSM